MLIEQLEKQNQVTLNCSYELFKLRRNRERTYV